MPEQLPIKDQNICLTVSERLRESLTIKPEEKTLMKGKWYPEEKIIKILKEIEAGNTVKEVC
jgi:hypothetical protein